MIYLTNINLSQNELQNAVIQPLAVAPASPKLGQIYTDSVSKRIKMYDGTQWNVVGAIIEDGTTNGHITVDGVDMEVYSLPIASATELGGVKIGTGIAISADGTISADLGGSFDAKADKVTSATSGNFAGLDSDGNLTDSGKKAADFEVAGAAAAVQGSTTETVASVDAKAEALKTTVGDSTSGLVKAVADNATEIAKKVDAVAGKQLSTEDYTSAEKTKLAGISAGAEVNVQADWDVADNTSDAFILNKPTKLSDFTNDEAFIKSSVDNLTNYYKKTETYTQTEIDQKIGALATIDIVVPQGGVLPATGKKNEIYLIPKSTAQTNNSYDEYIWTGTAFEKVGDTEIDLSTYLTKTGDASKTTVAFNTAATRENIATGEALDVIMGKVAKNIADLSAVAFSGSYNDLSDTPTHVKYQTANLGTVDGTQKIVTVVGTKVLNVALTDATTHEVVFADVTINGLTVTVKTAAAYANGIDILITYI